MAMPVRYHRDQLSFVDDLITDVDILKLDWEKSSRCLRRKSRLSIHHDNYSQ